MRHGWRARRTSTRRPFEELILDDPMTGMANMFDVGMVFAVALLIALLGLRSLPTSSMADSDPAAQRGGMPRLEALDQERVPVDRYRMGNRQMRGEGERLGTAYRLSNGEVVFVPDTPDDPGY